VIGRALTLCLAALLACADPPRSVELREDLGPDGLKRAPSDRVGLLYLRPGASLAAYSKVRIQLLEVAYRSPPSRSRTGPSGARMNYALAPDQRERLERDFLAAFQRELVDSGLFAGATDPGPDVLDVRGRLVDLVVEVPPESHASDRSYVRRAGELTLVLDVVDSRSGQALLRIADRRVLSQSAGSTLYRSSPVTHTAALRRALSRWARLLRDHLAALRQEGELPAA